MDILIWKNDEQHGPYSGEEMTQHLLSGRFTPEDMAWTEGRTEWVPLASLLPTATDPSSPPQNPICQQEPAPQEQPSGPMAPSKSLLEKAAVTARLAQKQAHKKKLEMLDLKQADYQIGSKACDNNLVPDRHPEIRGQIPSANRLRASRPLQSLAAPHFSLSESALKAGAFIHAILNCIVTAARVSVTVNIV
jgi:hypothetical protein